MNIVHVIIIRSFTLCMVGWGELIQYVTQSLLTHIATLRRRVKLFCSLEVFSGGRLNRGCTIILDASLLIIYMRCCLIFVKVLRICY